MNNENEMKSGHLSKTVRPRRNAMLFLFSLVAALGLTYLIREPGFSDSQDYVLFLLLFSVGLWLTEAIPPFAVALFIMAFLIFSLGNARFNEQPQDVAKYVQTFSSSIIWLMLGGFFLAEAMSKTGLDGDLFRFSIRLSGNYPKKILLGLMLTTMTASMILSNTATTAMVLASITPLLNKLGKAPFSKALLTGIPIAASLGGMGTIIGSPTNAIAAGALENAGTPVSFLQWMIIGVPLAILLTLAAWWMLSKKYIKENKPISFDAAKPVEAQETDQKRERRIVLAVLLVTILLWLTSSFHKLSVSAVAAIPIIILTMTGILKAADIRKLPWDTLLLVAGGLSLGLALQETAMLQYFTSSITSSSVNEILLLCIFGFGTMLFSNIMSNTATSTILIPLGLYMMPTMPTETAMVVGLAASTSLLLPVSTPPNAIAYSTGMIEQKDFLPGGILVGLLGPALIIAMVLLLV